MRSTVNASGAPDPKGVPAYSASREIGDSGWSLTKVNEPFRLRSWFYWLWGIICRRQSGVSVQYEQEADLAELFGDRMASNYDTEK